MIDKQIKPLSIIGNADCSTSDCCRGRVLDMEDDDNALLTLEEAAARLRLLRQTLKEAMGRGYLVPARVQGDRYWFGVEAVEAFGRQLGRSPSQRSSQD